MFKSRIIGGFAGLVVVLAGCSGADESGKTGGSTSNQTAKSPTTPAKDQDAADPAPASGDVNCVPAGTKGNEKGVGQFCAASAECTLGTFCTAGVAPKGAEFCTTFCSTDADCGAGASCYTDPRGRACVPAACIALQAAK